MTIARSEVGKVHFESPPADIPGLINASGFASGSMEQPASRAPETSSGSPPPPLRDRISPALNLHPVAMKTTGQWAVVGGLVAWVVLTAPVEQGVLPAAALLILAGLIRLVMDARINSGRVSQRGGLTTSNLVMLIAVGIAGAVGATLVSPVTLVMPGLVWSIAAVAPKQWMSNLATTLALLFAVGIAMLSASRFAEAPTSTSGSIALGAALVLSIILASIHGQRSGPRLLDTPADEADANDGVALEQPIATVRTAIAAQTEPTGIARTAARSISERFNPAFVAIVEQVPESKMFVPLAEIVGDASTIDLGRKLAGVTESALSKGAPLWMMDDADDTFTVTCRRLGIQAALIVPLEHLSHRIGAIQIAWSRPVGPVVLADTLRYASELAAMITPDLAIAQFATEIERGYFAAISSLASRVDDRDDFTRGHSRRVARHALTIAESMYLEEGQQRMLLYAAELHDIGRIGVSEHILSKTGALSASDWAEIRAYPRISADIVEPLSFFSDVREVVLHQNERWDGKGYPDRLSGLDIPLLSRILAVADAYDAMTSPRAYRSALSSQQALTELWKARGAKFDPEIVEAFVMSGSNRQRIA